VYYRTLKFKDYGKLSHQNLDDLQAGARIEVNDIKENPMDFALWKAAKPGEPAWQSPWGMGRPGWHIECSAMSNRYLGKTIDIHTGGMDLAFPHHENEIAQSEAANGCTFVNYWLHNGFINVDNKKMSKSLGNFFTVREAAAVYGYDCIRLFMLMSHYRSPLNYSTEILEQAQAALDRLKTAKENLDFFLANGRDGELTADDEAFIAGLGKYRDRFVEVMDDDFNTADAISVIFELVRDVNAAVSPSADPTKALTQGCRDIFIELCDVLGIPFGAEKDLDAEIEAMIEARQAARKAKNWAEADRIRDELKAQGIVLEDTPQGVKWHKA
jgi:cysteinyl-tRNA synthetase